ncbi:MAG: type III-A CRISPR-associated protein Csm2 [Clostridia bacterium]|nr:type III-A CRISPR-associated protein Csm2 [Clostridia bacterium]
MTMAYPNNSNQRPGGYPPRSNQTMPAYSGPRIDGSTTYDAVEAGQNLVDLLDANNMLRDFTTSQLRKVLSSAIVVKNRIDREIGEGDQLTDSIANEVQYLRVKLIYQMGREQKIKRCLGDMSVDLPAVIKNIGKDKNRFEQFFRLLETIVAFKKYKGGE